MDDDERRGWRPKPSGNPLVHGGGQPPVELGTKEPTAGKPSDGPARLCCLPSFIEGAVSKRARQAAVTRELNLKMHGALRQAGDELFALASFGWPIDRVHAVTGKEKSRVDRRAVPAGHRTMADKPVPQRRATSEFEIDLNTLSNSPASAAAAICKAIDAPSFGAAMAAAQLPAICHRSSGSTIASFSNACSRFPLHHKNLVLCCRGTLPRAATAEHELAAEEREAVAPPRDLATEAAVRDATTTAAREGGEEEKEEAAVEEEKEAAAVDEASPCRWQQRKSQGQDGNSERAVEKRWLDY
uniref:Uncharacterized protein n=1 Tax=Oryza glumipatula TaxID=40148 RepID=A0A0D9Z9W9_9ORYZ